MKATGPQERCRCESVMASAVSERSKKAAPETPPCCLLLANFPLAIGQHARAFECCTNFNLFPSTRCTRRPSYSHAARFHFNLYLSARYDCAVCGLFCCYIYYYIFIGMLLYELADIYRVSEHYSVRS